MTRPERLVLVTGTHTEVGKTWTGAAVAARLRAEGVRVAARKPAQSFDPGEPGPTDAEALGAATGEDPAAVCPKHRWYEVAMAPPMAADVLGRPEFTVADLVAELTWPPDCEVGLLEGAGGPRSPIAADGDTVSLADALEPEVVVLVADAGLGVINAVLLSLVPFAGRPVVVLLNRYDESDDLHRRNREWFAVEQPDLEVVTSVDALAAALIPEA